MDIGHIDSVATKGRSLLHRTSAAAKLLAFALVLTAVVVSTNLLIVVGVTLVLVAVGSAMRLPMRSLLALAAYPGLFAALFAIAVAPGLLAAALIIAKAVTAALGAVLLVFTTPYPQVFAPIQRVLPAILGDILLMTYRSLFLLIERFSHAMTAARLRAGVIGKDPLRSAQTATRSLGGVLLYSLDLSQRTYDIMRLRGYDTRLVVTPVRSEHGWYSTVVVVAAALIAGVAAAWRAGGATLAPFAWLPLSVAALVLAVAVAARALTREDVK